MHDYLQELLFLWSCATKVLWYALRNLGVEEWAVHVIQGMYYMYYCNSILGTCNWNSQTFDSSGEAMMVNPKRKPPCIGGMELVSLRCNRDFTSASSYGLGWCKYAIATQWYQFHTTDKCGFLFMPWITDQYIFVRYTKLVNKIGTVVAKVITFSIMTI